MTNQDLQGKLALITGASKGLGKAMAVALGQAGARLALVSRDLNQLKNSAGEVKDAGGSAEIFQADVIDEQQVQKLESEVSAKMGKVQIDRKSTRLNSSHEWISRMPS